MIATRKYRAVFSCHGKCHKLLHKREQIILRCSVLLGHKVQWVTGRGNPREGGHRGASEKVGTRVESMASETVGHRGLARTWSRETRATGCKRRAEDQGYSRHHGKIGNQGAAGTWRREDQVRSGKQRSAGTRGRTRDRGAVPHIRCVLQSPISRDLNEANCVTRPGAHTGHRNGRNGVNGKREPVQWIPLHPDAVWLSMRVPSEAHFSPLARSTLAGDTESVKLVPNKRSGSINAAAKRGFS